MGLWDNIKTTVVAVTMQMLAYFKPLDDELFILWMIFIVNFMAGLINDLIVNNGSFSFKKAWRCVTEVSMFFFMCLVIFTFGEKKGWADRSTQAVSFLTYVITWFYSQNILRNLKGLTMQGSAAHGVITFLYYIVSVEFVKKIPYLKQWVTDMNRNTCPDLNKKVKQNADEDESRQDEESDQDGDDSRTERDNGGMQS